MTVELILNSKGLTKGTLAQILQGATQMYGKPYTREILDGFWLCLDKYDYEDVEKAFREHYQFHGQFFPKPVDISKIIEKRQRYVMMRKVFGGLVPEVLDYERNLEINNFPEWSRFFRNIIYFPYKLAQIKLPARKLFTYAMLEKMGKHAGGMSYFWAKEEEDFALKGWMEVFGELTPEKVIRAICLILDGKYKNKRGECIPKTSIDFKDFWIETAQNSPPLFEDPKSEPVALLEYDRESEQERAKEARVKAKELVKRILGNSRAAFG